MAGKHEIEIIILPDGQVKLDVKGLRGPTCLTVVKKIADTIGDLKSTDIKPEYYERAQTEQKKTQGT